MSMNHFLKSLLVALLVTASASAATVFWTGAVSTDWSTAGNWSGTAGVPMAGTVPAAGDAAIIWWPSSYTVPNLPHVTGTAACNPIIIGNNYNGLTDINPTAMYIEAGAALTLGNSGDHWHTMGTVHHIGGTVNLNGNMYLATPKGYTGTQVSIYEMTGGTFTVGTGNRVMTVFNRAANAYAYLNIYGGTFDFCGTGATPTSSWRDCDLTGYPTTHDHFQINVKNSGKIIFPFNKGTTIAALSTGMPMLRSADPTQGLVLSFTAPTGTTYNQFTSYLANQKGWPSFQFTTATAKYGVPTLLTPMDGQGVPPTTSGPVNLTWMKPISKAGTEMAVNVRYGPVTLDANGIMLDPSTGREDPNGNSLPVFATGITGSNTIEVPALDTLIYGWNIQCVDPGVPGDPNYPAKIHMAPKANIMKVGNQPPVVTIPVAAAAPIGLRDGTVTWATTGTAADDGLPKVGGIPTNPAIGLTYSWSQTGGPAVPGLPTAYSSSGAISLNLTAANSYTFRLSCFDGGLTATSDVTVVVYANRCLAAQAYAAPYTVYAAAAGDLNSDCYVTFADFALLAANWNRCISLDPADPLCLP
jgi:hypothetical protein